MEVIALLRSKNRCLERFLDASERFCTKAETGDLADLEIFHASRDSALKAMELFDKKLNCELSLLSGSEKTPELLIEVENQLARKQALIKKIFEIDGRIIQLIENAKQALLKEMAGSQKSKDILVRFKSSWVKESGEELDKTL